MVLELPLPYVVAACAVVAVAVYVSGLLTARGAFAAFLIAVFMWAERGFEWLAVLMFFFFSGSAATKWKYNQKEKRGLAEARKGRRSIENVLGSAYSPLIFVIFTSPVGYLASVAAAMADNMASELGVMSENVRLITNLKKVPPGTNGGVSLAGLVISALGSAIVTATSPLLGVTELSTLLIVCVAGFSGSLFDSLLGATLERGGKLGKTEVNVAATLFAGLMAVAAVHFGLDSLLAAYI